MAIVTRELDEALRRGAEELLLEAGIWRFDAYGWLNADDVDPEFVGHAMWQTNPPFDILSEFGSRSAAPPLPDWQRLLAIDGADFEGLMQAARMSIGLFLVQAHLSRDTLFNRDNELFDLHRMSSIVYLSTASDRIRAVFIAAIFRKSADDYAKNKYGCQKRGWYTTPFDEAEATLANPSPELKKALQKAPPLAKKIHTFRTERNELIHKLATAIGKRERELIDQRHLRTEPHEIDFLSLETAATENEARYKQELSGTIKQLADWYELLACLSNEVFIIEHHRRSQPT
jgi:hypothetical protein